MSGLKLLLDFGASRIKAALYDPACGRIGATSECAAPIAEFGSAGEVEVEPMHYAIALDRVVAGLPAKVADVDAAYLCVEMHGFILVDANNRPRSRYISWRDGRAASGQRAIFPGITASARADFKARTGMRLRVGLPVLTVAAMEERGELPGASRLLSLAEWLVVCAGESSGVVHESLAAASGFYNLDSHVWDESIYALVGGSGRSGVAFNAITEDVTEPIGYLKVAGRLMPLFGGIGDMQAAFLGCRCDETQACINLGTGSQVISLVAGPDDDEAERRPVLRGQRARTLSHIPSGRAINVFAELIDEIALATGGAPGLLWTRMHDLTLDQILSSTLSIDLNMFPAAWRYAGGGSVTGVLEGGFGMNDFVASLVRSYAEQYRDALRLLDPGGRLTGLVLSGGVSRRIPTLAAYLGRLTGLPTEHSRSSEETLDGLIGLISMRDPPVGGRRSDGISDPNTHKVT